MDYARGDYCMQDRWAYLVFFLLLLVPFGAFFARPDFAYSDSYAFLLLTCKDANYGINGIPFFLFSILPCNFLALKVLLFLLCFTSGVFIIKLARLFSPKNGWRASYLLFLSAITVLEFIKFENDTFAYPLLFASLYFFWHGIKKSSRKSFLAAFLLLVPAGLVWAGAVYYIIAYALHFSFLILAVGIAILVPATPFNWKTLLGNIVRTNRVAEDLPLKIISSHFVLVFGFWGLAFERILMPQALFFFAMGMLSNKFWVLSLPFLAVGMVLLLERMNSRSLNTIFVVVSLFMVAGLAQSVWLQPPTQDNWEAIDYALAIDSNVGNDWGMGYWVLWRNGETESYGSFHRQKPPQPSQIIITEKELSECKLLEQAGKVKVYCC